MGSGSAQDLSQSAVRMALIVAQLSPFEQVRWQGSMCNRPDDGAVQGPCEDA